MSNLIFNEAEYPASNLDVAAAGKERKFCSGCEHYEKHDKKRDAC
jgi:hypothetical protein